MGSDFQSKLHSWDSELHATTMEMRQDSLLCMPIRIPYDKVDSCMCYLGTKISATCMRSQMTWAHTMSNFNAIFTNILSYSQITM
jgi:hypothetical protein